MIQADAIIDFTLAYNNYKKPLYNYVFKMIDDRIITDDIIQNVFLKYYENLSLIKNSSATGNWLFTTARNEVFGFLRKKKIRSENYIDENFEYASDTNINEFVEELEIKEMIDKEISKIDDDSREIFVLREYSGLSYSEISNILGIEQSIVKGRLFRTRQKLIDKFSKLVR